MALIIRNVRNQEGGGDTVEAKATAITLDGEIFKSWGSQNAGTWWSRGLCIWDAVGILPLQLCNVDTKRLSHGGYTASLERM